MIESFWPSVVRALFDVMYWVCVPDRSSNEVFETTVRSSAWSVSANTAANEKASVRRRERVMKQTSL
jgi:hypothetical protein